MTQPSVTTTRLLGSALLIAAALGAAPVLLSPTAALAQGTGGHGGGSGGHGGGSGGHGGEEGEEGHGGGHGGHGEEEIPVAAVGAGGEAAGGGAGGILRPGNYVKFGLGAAHGSAGNASWLPPGYPGDPQVFFDLNSASAGMAEVAFGRAYGNGWRAEAALTVFGATDHAGPWSYTIPATPGPHADMAASVRSTAIMANIYRDFATSGKVVPFVVAGLGMSENSMDPWTRTNPDAGRTTRTFEGASNTDFAWSVGVGMSMQLDRGLGSSPAILEVAVRHYDLGSVTGGADAVPGSGAGGNPVQPLTFDVTKQVLSIGLRIPLN